MTDKLSNGDVQDHIARLSTDLSDANAALVLAFQYAQDADDKLLAEVREELVGRLCAAGDLPRALAAATLGNEADVNRKAAFTKIAKRFSKSAKREKAAMPPPLPPQMPKAAPRKDNISSLLEAFLASDAPAPISSPPSIPLFSSLKEKPLGHFLEAFDAQLVQNDAAVIEQGGEGSHAFVLAEGVLEVIRSDGEESTSLATLSAGALFGEMALVSEAPRVASVVSKGVAIVLSVGREILENKAAKTPEISRQIGEFCRTRMLQNLTNHSDIFVSVPANERSELVARFKTRHFAEGDVLTEQGQDHTSLFVVASGEVGVDVNGTRVATLGAGDVVGEISMVLRRPANATVIALMPTVTLALSDDRFFDLIDAHPKVLAELYKTATGRDERTRSLVGMESEAILL